MARRLDERARDRDKEKRIGRYSRDRKRSACRTGNSPAKRTATRRIYRYGESTSCQCVSGTHVPFGRLARVTSALLSFVSFYTGLNNSPETVRFRLLPSARDSRRQKRGSIGRSFSFKPATSVVPFQSSPSRFPVLSLANRSSPTAYECPICPR